MIVNVNAPQSHSDNFEGRLVVAVVLSLTAGVVALSFLLANYLSAWDECAENGCAVGGPSTLWQGRVFTAQGVPASRARVWFTFASIAPQLITVATDDEGRFCLRWPNETEQAHLSVDVHALGAKAVPGIAALARQLRVHHLLVITPNANYGMLAGSTASNAYGVTDFGWNPRLDRAARCTSGSPPWFRINNLSHNWRSVLLIGGPIVAWLGITAGGILCVRRKTHWRLVLIGSCVLMAACVGFYLLVWVPLPRVGA